MQIVNCLQDVVSGSLLKLSLATTNWHTSSLSKYYLCFLIRSNAASNETTHW